MASFTVPCPKSSALALFKGSSNQQPLHHHKISFAAGSSRSRNGSFLAGSSSIDNQNVLSKFQGPARTQSTIWKVHSQLSELLLNLFSASKVAEKSSNSTPATQANLEIPSSGETEMPRDEPSAGNAVPDAAAVSAFMAQVSDLVKLVDSRDIIELQLKQLDCEVIIRKKEALPQPAAAPVVMMQPHQYQSVPPSQPPPAPSMAPVSASPAPSASSPPPPAKSTTSSHPPLKCPMAGTFYRCPGPGEPPFVKVGDKVQKGQVVCIIEAMKLMNEIEADQSGTLVEILVEEGKPVSVDMPLFVIEP